ncbi:MAG: hypothetical protein MNPFHGCM_00402 [Gemmatimonadaceae bacterium]|nr:hypothetical protein [Gemmatimonadaceae bacterium]
MGDTHHQAWRTEGRQRVCANSERALSQQQRARTRTDVGRADAWTRASNPLHGLTGDLRNIGRCLGERSPCLAIAMESRLGTHRGGRFRRVDRGGPRAIRPRDCGRAPLAVVTRDLGIPRCCSCIRAVARFPRVGTRVVGLLTFGMTGRRAWIAAMPSTSTRVACVRNENAGPRLESVRRWPSGTGFTSSSPRHAVPTSFHRSRTGPTRSFPWRFSLRSPSRARRSRIRAVRARTSRPR